LEGTVHAGAPFERTGMFEAFPFRFAVVPVDEVGEPDEQEHTRELSLILKVTDSLKLSGRWRTLTPEAFAMVRFAFLREKLLTDGLPERDDQVYTLDNYIDGDRFRSGPPYTIENIHPEIPFVVSSKPERIGFNRG
jgi:hypothetical protein